MQRKRRLLICATSIFLVLTTLFTGCGDTKASSENGTSTTAKQTSNASSVTEQTSDAKETVKLKYFYPYSGVVKEDSLKLVQDKVNEILKPINAELEITAMSWSEWDQKAPLVITSGEEVDLMWTASWKGYFQDVGKGAFQPLNELLEKNGPDIKSTLNPIFLSAPVVKGNLYAIPVNKEIGSCHGWIVVKEIADKYNFDTTKVNTLEDFEPFLEAIKKNEPEMIPMWMNASDYQLSADYIYKTESSKIDSRYEEIPGFGELLYFDNDTKKVISKFTTEEVIERYNLYRKWYKLGYINENAMTTKEERIDLVKSGKIAMFPWGFAPGADTGAAKRIGKPVYIIKVREPFADTQSATGSMTAIPTSSKNAEKAMQVMNEFYKNEDLVNTINWGLEGKHYKMVSDNVMDVPDGVGSFDDTGFSPITGWEIGNMMLNYLMKGEPEDKWAQYEEINKSTKAGTLLGFNVSMDPIKSEVAAVQNTGKEFLPILRSGAADPEETLKRLNDKINANGMQKVIDEIQKQYDEWIATK